MRQARNLLFFSRDVEAAALAVTNVFAKFLCEIAPDFQTLEHHGDFPRIASLHSNPSPVPPRLLAGDVSLLAQHHADASASKEPGRGDANDAAADDNDVSFFRDTFGTGYA